MTTNKIDIADMIRFFIDFADSREARRALGDELCDGLKALATNGVFVGTMWALLAIVEQNRKPRPRPVARPPRRLVARPLVVHSRKRLLLPPASSTWESDEVRRARTLLGVSTDATPDDIQKAFTAKAKLLAAVGTDPTPLFHAACLLIVVTGSKATPNHAA